VASLIAKCRDRDDGAELIEMAIVLPLLLLLIMGIFDFGFLFQRYIVLTNAAAEGARVASLPGYTAADVTARVSAYAINSGVDGPVNTATLPVALPGPDGATWPGSEVTVTHTYTMQYVGPIAGLFGAAPNGNITMTSRATMRHAVAAAP
jgi:Flp pilus assembly protein TadG